MDSIRLNLQVQICVILEKVSLRTTLPPSGTASSQRNLIE